MKMNKVVMVLVIIAVVIAGIVFMMINNQGNGNGLEGNGNGLEGNGNSDKENVTLEFTEEEKAFIEELQIVGVLKVATREIETVYKIDENGESDGFNYHLLKAFADYIEVGLDLKVVEFSDYFKREGVVADRVKTDPDYSYTPDLLKEVDLYCDVISVVPWRKKLFDYIEITPVRQLLIHRSDEEYKSIEDIDGKSFALKTDTSYEYRLREIEDQLGIDVEYIQVATTYDQMVSVSIGHGDLTIKDSNIAIKEVADFENLTVGIPLADVQFQGWAVRKDNKVLQSIIGKYIEYAQKTGLYNRLWYDEFGVTLNEYLWILDVEGKYRNEED